MSKKGGAPPRAREWDAAEDNTAGKFSLAREVEAGIPWREGTRLAAERARTRSFDATDRPFGAHSTFFGPRPAVWC